MDPRIQSFLLRRCHQPPPTPHTQVHYSAPGALSATRNPIVARWQLEEWHGKASEGTNREGHRGLAGTSILGRYDSNHKVGEHRQASGRGFRRIGIREVEGDPIAWLLFGHL